MRGNTNPCSVCEYCDDSCDVCLHQPYELSHAALYHEASSGDEYEDGYASSDVDSDSDEDGSWFTTPWSKLIKQRVLGYEVDPEIGVQLSPIETPQDAAEEETQQQEMESKGEKHRRKKEQQTPEEEEVSRRERRKRRLGRRRRRDSPAVEGAEEAAVGEVWPQETVVAALPANDEAAAQYSEGTTELAKSEVPHESEALALPKDAHNNSWRESVQSCAPQVSVS